jgi:hypothetical protein
MFSSNLSLETSSFNLESILHQMEKHMALFFILSNWGYAALKQFVIKMRVNRANGTSQN